MIVAMSFITVAVSGFLAWVRLARGGPHGGDGRDGGVVGDGRGGREDRRGASAVRFAGEWGKDLSGDFYTKLWARLAIFRAWSDSSCCSLYLTMKPHKRAISSPNNHVRVIHSSSPD